MLEWLQLNINLSTLIWLFPATFMLHDFEEIIFVEAWFKKYGSHVAARVPFRMQKVFADMALVTSARFAIPVLLQFVVYIGASYLAAEKQIVGPFVGFNLLLFLHIFTHVGQSLLFRVYALGTLTAVLITLPYSLYVGYRLLLEGIIDYGDFIRYAPYGLVTIGIVLAGHRIAREVLR
ncbi:HXXEE domain-containing protein [Paenibacillus aestuarii]|uniref:HXXEE domain-containing protein n=1 Tax=Paenibacillus aestuarii TaxID=516965 RepID=A0ABW0KHM0_9BACL|nr:HXXEE domain-containing protein [Paenibacillus aestuarii]